MLRAEGDELTDLLWLLSVFSEYENTTFLTARLDPPREFYAYSYEALTSGRGEFLGWCLFVLLVRECERTPDQIGPEEEAFYDLLNELKVLLGDVLLMEPYNRSVLQSEGLSDVEVLRNIVRRLCRSILDGLADPGKSLKERSFEYFLGVYGYDSEGSKPEE